MIQRTTTPEGHGIYTVDDMRVAEVRRSESGIDGILMPAHHYTAVLYFGPEDDEAKSYQRGSYFDAVNIALDHCAAF